MLQHPAIGVGKNGIILLFVSLAGPFGQPFQLAAGFSTPLFNGLLTSLCFANDFFSGV